LDHRFLAASFGPGSHVKVESLPAALPPGNGFTLHGNGALHDPLHWAVQELERETDPEARRQLLRTGDRVAVLGFHAGDMLFLLQALSLEQTNFRSVIVPPDYADIVSYLRPDLLCRVVQHPVPHREGYHVVDEAAVLRDFIAQLLQKSVYCGRFFHIVRPFFRKYNASRHHLREGLAFTVGGPGHALRQLPPMSAQSQRDYGLMRPQPGRVLVQFDAGWELKAFPPDRRGELLELLLGAGYAPVVLGSAEASHPDVPAQPYTDLASFRVLLGSAQALIGSDSFPAHFANAYGIPTVTLFGNTKPANSRGLESPRYRYLNHPMSCIPCDQVTRCLLDNGTSCQALPRAGEVLAALQALVPPPSAARLQPLPLAECERLIAEVVPLVEFQQNPPMSTAEQERYLDNLYSRVEFDTITACPLCNSRELVLVGYRFRLPVARCPGCGLWLVTRRLNEVGLSVLYNENYWTGFMRLHGYPIHVERYMFDYMAALERVRDIAALVPPGGATLDIGCSIGALPRRLAEFGYRAAGLELDRPLGKKATFLSGVPVYASQDEIAARGERFDVVSMFDVFEHLYDPVAYLKSLRAIMAPGGYLLLETFRTDSPAFQREQLQHEDVKPIEHPFMYMQKHIDELLGRAGLRTVSVTYPLGPDHARIRVAARWHEPPIDS
jgi:SAM-dependent methyltransferase